MKGVCVEQRHKNEQSGQGSKEIGAMMAKRDDDYWDKPANGASQWSQPMDQRMYTSTRLQREASAIIMPD